MTTAARRLLPSMLAMGSYLGILAATPAQAAPPETLPYGSRAGMDVTVVSVTGVNGANSVIRVRHTRANAVQFCREYVGRVTNECIRETLQIPINEFAAANCETGEFVDLYGDRHQFLGPNLRPDEINTAEFRIMNLATEEVANGSAASGYTEQITLYRRLCPKQFPAGRSR